MPLEQPLCPHLAQRGLERLQGAVYVIIRVRARGEASPSHHELYTVVKHPQPEAVGQLAAYRRR